MEKEHSERLDEEVKQLRESFKRIDDEGIDALRYEKSILNQAKELGISPDDYRRLYELKDEKRLPVAPKAEHWRDAPTVWIKYVQQMPRGSKRMVLWSYVRKGILKVIQGGALLTLLASGVHYLLTTSQREKQAQDQMRLAHYQAWQMVFAAKGSSGEGGRIEALRDLARDGSSLEGVDLSNISLIDIDLSGADLRGANFKGATLSRVNLEASYLLKANFQHAYLNQVNLTNASLWKANFRKANLIFAKLKNAYLCHAQFEGADLSSADFSGAYLCSDRTSYEAPLSPQSEAFSKARLCQTIMPDTSKVDRDCNSEPIKD